jgi:REP element-mobilizing transposase RayT
LRITWRERGVAQILLLALRRNIIDVKRTHASDRLGFKSFYRRNLPHIQPTDATLFVTFRLTGSLPQHVLVRIAEERRAIQQKLDAGQLSTARSGSAALARRHFAMLERCLDRATDGPTWLFRPKVAYLVCDALHYRDGRQYRLDAFSIMPNHVHALFAPLSKNGIPISLSSIMHSLKRNSAKHANEVLQRSGSFWEHETFDRYVRDHAEWKRTVTYVLNNPVKAGLVKTWQEWPWNYLRDGETSDAG